MKSWKTTGIGIASLMVTLGNVFIAWANVGALPGSVEIAAVISAVGLLFAKDE